MHGHFGVGRLISPPYFAFIWFVYVSTTSFNDLMSNKTL